MALMGLSGLFACRKETSPVDNVPSPQCIPTDLLVKTKKEVRIDQVFDLINTFNQPVEYIYNGFYTSALHPDSLQYVLNYLNQKSYTNDGKTWFVSGYRHYQTQVITIFPHLYRMNDRANQADWLASMKLLKLTEVTDRKDVGGSIVFFHVPEKEETEWQQRFKTLDFVEWAERNCYADIRLF